MYCVTYMDIMGMNKCVTRTTEDKVIHYLRTTRILSDVHYIVSIFLDEKDFGLIHACEVQLPYSIAYEHYNCMPIYVEIQIQIMKVE